jgi:hypothetical protein
MLDGLHLTENDSLYLYNYGFNKLEKLPLNKLKAVAYLSPYSMDDEELDPSYYMVGFQLAYRQSNDLFDKYSNAVAYFETKIHSSRKMKAIQWKKADAGAAKKYFTQSKLKPGKHIRLTMKI